jgi:SprT-like family
VIETISDTLAMGTTREAWLIQAVDRLRPLFSEKLISLPSQIRVSCGWPHDGNKGRGASHAIGQCWSKTASHDGTSELFISPVLDDSVSVAEVLVHELIHSADDCRSGHGAPFKKIALAMGLEGPMRSTVAGPELRERLNALVAGVGLYPHARLDPTQAYSKQRARLVKVVCDRRRCRYALWTTRIWLDLGTPVCVCGSGMSEIPRR